MREIKFRAWDGEEMIILENSGLQYYDFEGSYSLGFTVDGYTDFWAHEQYSSATKKANAFPIMQSVGYSTKGGVEVFEGDIIRGNHKDSFFITRLNGGLQLLNLCYMNQKYNELVASPTCDPQTKSWICDGEVIGNIYQHPFLLINE